MKWNQQETIMQKEARNEILKKQSYKIRALKGQPNKVPKMNCNVEVICPRNIRKPARSRNQQDPEDTAVSCKNLTYMKLI